MRDLSETVAQIAQQLGLDTGEIEARQRFLEFGAADIARLKRAHPLIEDQRDEFAQRFTRTSASASTQVGFGAYRECLSAYSGHCHGNS